MMQSLGMIQEHTRALRIQAYVRNPAVERARRARDCRGLVKALLMYARTSATTRSGEVSAYLVQALEEIGYFDDVAALDVHPIDVPVVLHDRKYIPTDEELHEILHRASEPGYADADKVAMLAREVMRVRRVARGEALE